MKKLYIQHSDKISAVYNRNVPELLSILEELKVPFYVYDEDTKKIFIKGNCDQESIENAKKNSLCVTAKRKRYYVVLKWWAGSRVVGIYSTSEEAYRRMANKRSCYQGNGYFVCEERDEEKLVPINENILQAIISQYNGIDTNINIKWAK